MLVMFADWGWQVSFILEIETPTQCDVPAFSFAHMVHFVVIRNNTTLVSSSCSSLFTALGSMERWLHSCSHPHYRLLSSMKTVNRAIVVITATVTLLYSHVLYCISESSESGHSPCGILIVECVYFNGLLHLTLFCIEPCLIMSMFVFLTLGNTRRSFRRVGNDTSTSATRTERRPKRTQATTMTVLMLTQICLVILSNLPAGMHKIYLNVSVNDRKSHERRVIEAFSFQLLSPLTHVATGVRSIMNYFHWKVTCIVLFCSFRSTCIHWLTLFSDEHSIGVVNWLVVECRFFQKYVEPLDLDRFKRSMLNRSENPLRDIGVSSFEKYYANVVLWLACIFDFISVFCSRRAWVLIISKYSSYWKAWKLPRYDTASIGARWSVSITFMFVHTIILTHTFISLHSRRTEGHLRSKHGGLDGKQLMKAHFPLWWLFKQVWRPRIWEKSLFQSNDLVFKI